MAQISSVWSQSTSATKKIVPFEGIEKGKFIAPDGASSDYFGYCVAVSYSGETIAVGAYGDDDKGSNSGSAYVYRRNGTTWSFHKKIVPVDGFKNDYFADNLAVSGDGNRIAIGSHQDDDKGTNSGSAYVYVLQDNDWVLEAKLTASTGASGDYFGKAVDINHSGNRVVVGAYTDDDLGTDSGSAFVYVRNGSVWTQEAILRSPTGRASDYFGRAVAISGDGLTIISGAYQDDDEGTNSGAAFLYRYINGTWGFLTKLLHTDVAASDYFAWSVDLSYNGKFAIISSYCDDDRGSNSGSVHIFTEIDGTWAREIKLVPSDGAAKDYFGYSVSMSNNGKSIAISSHLDDDGGQSASGSIYFYNRIDGVWTLFKKLYASDSAASDYFGFSTALSGNGKVVVAGSYMNDDKGTSSGSAYVFE